MKNLKLALVKKYVRLTQNTGGKMACGTIWWIEKEVEKYKKYETLSKQQKAQLINETYEDICNISW